MVTEDLSAAPAPEVADAAATSDSPSPETALETPPEGETSPEPTPRELLTAIQEVQNAAHGAQNEARAASGRANKLAEEIQALRASQPTQFEALLNALGDPDDDPAAETPAPAVDRTEKFKQALAEAEQANAPTAPAVSQEEAALRGILIGHGIDPNQYVAMASTAYAQGDNTFAMQGQTATEQLQDLVARGIPEFQRRQATATNPPPNAVPAGTPASPAPSGAGGYRTFAELENAYAKDEVDLQKFIELADRFEDGRAFMARHRKRR